MTQRVAVVDIGTNTLKFSVTEVEDDGSETIFDSHADTVRLGAGVQKSGTIDPDRIERTVASLQSYESVARSMGANVFIGVATAALRMARNGSKLVDRIALETGWDVRVITGDEEATLAFNGLAALLPAHGDVLLADVGGGSTELIMVRDRSIQVSESIEVGSGTLADRCFTRDPPGREAVQLAFKLAVTTFKASRAIGFSPGSALYLSGGNGQFLREVAGWNQVSISFEPGRFDDLVEYIAVRESDSVAQFLGIAQERARMLPAGAAIAKALVDILDPVSIEAVPSGIRGGLLAEWLANHRRSTAPC